jgi:hypothetical protein
VGFAIGVVGSGVGATREAELPCRRREANGAIASANAAASEKRRSRSFSSALITTRSSAGGTSLRIERKDAGASAVMAATTAVALSPENGWNPVSTS